MSDDPVDLAFGDVLAGLDAMQAKFNEGFDVMRAGVVAAGRRRTFDPLTLTGLLAWYDASDTVSITHSSGAVSQWNDKSGNGRHLTQSAAGNKPITGTRTENGLNVLDFDRNHWLDRTSFNVPIPSMVLMVVRLDATGIYNSMLDSANGTGFPPFALSINIDGDNAWTLNAGSNASSGLVAATGYRQVTCVFNGASSAFFHNGTQHGGALNPNSNASNGFRIGQWRGASTNDGSGLNGTVGEALVLSSTTDRVAGQNYLKAKWATP